MTKEELEKIPLHFVAHINMENQHQIVYASDNGEIGTANIQPYRGGRPYGKCRKSYRLKSRWYDKYDEFLEAIKDYHVPFNVIEGCEK